MHCARMGACFLRCWHSAFSWYFHVLFVIFHISFDSFLDRFQETFVLVWAIIFRVVGVNRSPKNNKNSMRKLALKKVASEEGRGELALSELGARRRTPLEAQETFLWSGGRARQCTFASLGIAFASFSFVLYFLF